MRESGGEKGESEEKSIEECVYMRLAIVRKILENTGFLQRIYYANYAII